MARKPDIDFEMVQEDPPRALPESYREIVNNIARVKANGNDKWYRIAKFPKLGQAHNKRLVLNRRAEYALFEFKSGKLNPPEEEFESGLWCKWVGVRKTKRAQAAEDAAEPEPRRLRSVRGGGE